MQHKIDQTKIDKELLQYASDVVTNDYTCRDVRKWLEEYHYDVKSFLVALTMIKKGNLEEESYKAVGQEFLAKFKTEIKQNWSPRFQSGAPQPTPLYNALLASLEKDEQQPSTLSFS